VLINVVGDLGSGKTLFLCIYSFLSKKKQIYANFRIENKKVKPFTIELLFRKDLKDCDILLDEGYIYLESRTSLKKSNLIFSYLLFQSRKRNINILTTSQLLNSIDLRFRNLADFIIRAHNKRDYFKYEIYKTSGKKVNTIFLPYHKARPFFNKYDTLEVVSPSDISPEFLNSKEIKKIGLKLKEEYLKDEVFSKLKPTKTNISSFLKIRKVSLFFTDILYALLQGDN